MSGPHDRHLPLPSLLAGGVGNLLEWYDFGLYGLFAPILAPLFFPAHDRIASLIGAYSGFAIGFAARPLGGVVLGHVGDRVGRRAVMVCSIVLMGFATTAMAILPTYEAIGVGAPMLLLLIRVLQGFSVGGEYTGSVAYLVETAPSRATRNGWQRRQHRRDCGHAARGRRCHGDCDVRSLPGRPALGVAHSVPDRRCHRSCRLLSAPSSARDRLCAKAVGAKVSAASGSHRPSPRRDAAGAPLHVRVRRGQLSDHGLPSDLRCGIRRRRRRNRRSRPTRQGRPWRCSSCRSPHG